MEIYILQSKEIDIMFGEHDNEWKNEGWTDDIKIALEWTRRGHRGSHKKFETLEKMSYTHVLQY